MNSLSPPPVDPAFAADVLAGLSHTHKSLPCRWLYDARGSALFEEITNLPEYYPTRTEAAILEAHAGEMARRLPAQAVLVEFGSGSSRKTEILLQHMANVAAYVPIDVSVSALEAAQTRLAQRWPDLRVVPVVGDFLEALNLPDDLANAPRVGFFPGSTIGNLTPSAAQDLLKGMGCTLGSLLQTNAALEKPRLIIGVDLQKDLDRLIPAYDDAQGVTAAFNLNLLTRINRELRGDFNVAAFAHAAVWNAEAARIEMHLVSLCAQRVRVAGRHFDFAKGERIHTENSHKYTLDGFAALAAAAGWATAQVWTDPDNLFSVHELVTAD